MKGNASHLSCGPLQNNAYKPFSNSKSKQGINIIRFQYFLIMRKIRIRIVLRNFCSSFFKVFVTYYIFGLIIILDEMSQSTTLKNNDQKSKKKKSSKNEKSLKQLSLVSSYVNFFLTSFHICTLFLFILSRWMIYPNKRWTTYYEK